jgi:hypothetical protein
MSSKTLFKPAALSSLPLPPEQPVKVVPVVPVQLTSV